MTFEEELGGAEDRADAMMLEADVDCLTGLLNRRGLERRTRGREWGWYVLADLDGFKAAQDHHPQGHAYGDRILCEFAEFLFSHTRQNTSRVTDAILCRNGGDEFVVWCETRLCALAVRDRIREWRSLDDKVGASAGLGRLRVEAADAAMYLDKQRKKA